MPQSNVRVSEVDLRSDMRNYYRHSCVTYRGTCALVSDYSGNGNSLKAHIRLLGDRDWGDEVVVLASNLDVVMPRLGYVEFNGNWYLLSRKPARRMRKGYCDESIQSQAFGPRQDAEFHVMDPKVLNQIWNGNSNRISHDSIILENNILFQGEVVAKIVDKKVILVPGKEKLGEYVCKLLAANWEFHSSKHSLLPLDS